MCNMNITFTTYKTGLCTTIISIDGHTVGTIRNQTPRGFSLEIPGHVFTIAIDAPINPGGSSPVKGFPTLAAAKVEATRILA